MKSLLIDDLRIPGDARNKKNIPADAVVARNYADGIKLLHAGYHGEPFDVLYLDHDLADFSGPEGKEMTGYHIMCWLEEFPQYLPKENIIIVSDNSSGMIRMRQVINKLYGRDY